MPRPRRFSCSPRGSIGTGQRRLKILLLGLAVVLLVAATAAWAVGRIFPGLLALAVALVSAGVWRLSIDLQPLWLELEPGCLSVQTRRQRIRVGLVDATARQLTRAERDHLQRLASAGGLVASSGGFESHRLGEFDLYASDLASAVLIETEEGRFIVTPDQPERFVAAIDQFAVTSHGSD